MTVKFKLLHAGASLPTYQTKNASGMDLCASQPGAVHVGEVYVVSTGVAVEIPEGYEAQVRPRSGLAAKYGVTVLNAPGTIDSDYRGEIKVILVNHGQLPFYINHGARIAQLVIAPVVHAEAEIVQEFTDTDRGSGGFGHTGV